MHTPPSPFGCKHWHLSPLIQKINLTAVGHCSKLHVSLFFHTLSISEHLQHNCHPPTQPTCTTAGCLLQAARVFVPPHSFDFRAFSTQLSPPYTAHLHNRWLLAPSCILQRRKAQQILHVHQPTKQSGGWKEGRVSVSGLIGRVCLE